MRAQVDGASLFVQESGAEDQEGPALVFTHFFGGSSRTWSEVIALLKSDFRCIAPDARGFGDSDAPPDGYRVSQGADDVLALLQVLEIEDFVLVGHSMGGKIALELASRRPKYLQSLVLLAPSPPTPEPMEEEERARLRSGWAQRGATLETLSKITARPLPPQVLVRAVEDSLRSSRAAWQSWLDAGSREDISAQMSRIEVPALVVAGAEDAGLTPQVLEREVVARIANARLETIAGAGHLLPLEAAGEVARLIREATFGAGDGTKSASSQFHLG